MNINIDNTLTTILPVLVGTNAAGAIYKTAYARPVSYYYNMDTNKWEIGIKYWYEVETIENGITHIAQVQFFSEVKKMTVNDIAFMWNNVVTTATASLSHEQMMPKATLECLLYVLNNGQLFSAPLNSWVKRNAVV